MRTLLVVFGVLISSQMQAQSRVLVEVQAPAQAYVSQPVEVVIRLGFDAEWFEQHGVPLFRQQVDVPIHLECPWLVSAVDRAVTFLPPREGDTRVRVVVGDRLVDGIRGVPWEREGRSFACVLLRCRWLPLVAGASAVESVGVRYAFANEFQEHLLRGREPVDRQEKGVASQSLELRVLPLPKETPPRWSGAVGEFEVGATSRGEQVHVGDVFSVEVTVWGDGNLEEFGALPPPVVEGFFVQGIREKRSVDERVFVLDCVALRPGMLEMPGVPFVAFSPLARQFVTSLSPSVPVRVLPLRQGASLSRHVQELVDADAAKRAPSFSVWPLAWGLLGLVVVALCVYRLRGRSKGRRALLDSVHALRLAVVSANDPDAAADAFERVMSQVAGVSTFSASETWGALRERGVSPEGLQQLRSLHGELDAARFGGLAPDAEAVIAAVQTLAEAVS